jgi:hypothetical protein
MREWPPIDSRQYITAFELHSTFDCPPDFELPSTLATFDAGIFLPRDDPDWFGRSSYPPRILLLKDNALHLMSHPAARQPPSRWELDQISAVESGHLLLKGWLRFTGSAFDCTIRYNTRGFPPIYAFMRHLRTQLLKASSAVPWPAMRAATLDIKFTNALARELDSEEILVMQFFQPPRELGSGIWPLSRRRSIAGDLLALTARRLLWITDRERGYYSRFGSIASYAPLDAIVSIGLRSSRSGDILQVDLNSGSTWQLPTASENREALQHIADDFAAALQLRNRARKTEIRQ